MTVYISIINHIIFLFENFVDQMRKGCVSKNEDCWRVNFYPKNGKLFIGRAKNNRYLPKFEVSGGKNCIIDDFAPVHRSK